MLGKGCKGTRDQKKVEAHGGHFEWNTEVDWSRRLVAVLVPAQCTCIFAGWAPIP